MSVFGIKDGHVHLAHSVDGLGALSNAVSAIRRSLDRPKGGRQRTLSVRFPEILPMSYGLEFHNKLCQLVDAEIAKKERALSRGRLARRKSTWSCLSENFLSLCKITADLGDFGGNRLWSIRHAREFGQARGYQSLRLLPLSQSNQRCTAPWQRGAASGGRAGDAGAADGRRRGRSGKRKVGAP